MTEPTRLTCEQLVPLVAALQHREAAALAGRLIKRPLPDCPTCGQPPSELMLSNDQIAQFRNDQIAFGFRPCGHNFTADGGELDRAYSAARASGAGYASPWEAP